MQTIKTSKQQKTSDKTIPVTMGNVEYKSKEFTGKIGTLNVYKINIKVLNFIFRVKNNIIPSALQEKFIKRISSVEETYY